MMLDIRITHIVEDHAMSARYHAKIVSSVQKLSRILKNVFVRLKLSIFSTTLKLQLSKLRNYMVEKAELIHLRHSTSSKKIVIFIPGGEYLSSRCV